MKHFLLFASMFIGISVGMQAQTFNLSFSAYGDSETVDSVFVKNLSSDNEVRLGGGDVLHLVPGAGSRFLQSGNSHILIYPNPTENACNIEFMADKAGPAVISVNDVSGKTLLKWTGNLTRAVHVFRLNGIGYGVYTITIRSEAYLYSGKLVGTGYQETGLNIEKIMAYSDNEPEAIQLNNTKSDTDMPYLYGELLLIEAVSVEGHRTVKTMILNQSDQDLPDRGIAFNFVNCLDAEGYMYKTVEIGDYVWMAEDLNTAMYRDSSSIPEVADAEAWVASNNGAWSYYNNDNQEPKLYNWYAATDSRKICPAGWHMPGDEEWELLEIAVGLTDSLAEGTGWRGNDLAWKLKESGTDFWISNEGDLVNLSGFSAKPSGIRNFAGNYFYKGENTAWWTADESFDLNAWCRGLQHDVNSIYREDGRKIMGLSLRCMKNYPPVLTTTAVTGVTIHEAVSGGTITNYGGGEVTAAGVIWGIDPNITIEWNMGFTSNYTGADSFNSQMTGLYDTTTYYVRAYATNDAGTGYGDPVSFTTFADTITKVEDVDDNIYDIITVGGQRMLGQNLKTTRYSDGTEITNQTDIFSWESSTEGLFCWYNNDPSNRDTYGALYNWHAVNTGKLCPNGWHVPVDYEWKLIEIELGMSAGDADLIDWRGTDQGSRLAGENTLWNDGALEADPDFGASGFDLVPGGYMLYEAGGFIGINEYGYYWSSSEFSTMDAWHRAMNFDSTQVYRNDAAKHAGLSVRCIKDNANLGLPVVTTANYTDISPVRVTAGGEVITDGGTTVTSRGLIWGNSPDITIYNNLGMVSSGDGNGMFSASFGWLTCTSSYYYRAYAINSMGVAYGDAIEVTTPDYDNCNLLTDFDGNIYKTVTIGTQCWMRENLKTTTLNDGTPLLNETDSILWSELVIPAYCWYDNDEAVNGSVYGALYNWYAVNTGKLCPTGWRVPSDEDWLTLTDYLGGVDTIGRVMKESGIAHWVTLNPNNSNATGFTAIPSGDRFNNTTNFSDLGYIAFWWSSNSIDATYAWNRDLAYHVDEIWTGPSVKAAGLAVRCVQGASIPIVPEIETVDVTNVSFTTAECGGNITNDAGQVITEKGLVWSLDENPSLTNYAGYTTQGPGNGQFNVQITGLNSATHYYVRAYAQYNGDVVYADTISFTTAEQGEDITDADGNVYTTVRIGTNFWSSTSIKSKHYNDGTEIPVVSGNWAAKGTVGMAWYDDDEAMYGSTYGALYSWAAIDTGSNGGHNICPAGYHVANSADWNSLITKWGGANLAGNPLKEAGTVHWETGNTGTNKSGFTALPGGQRLPEGTYMGMSSNVWYWSADSIDSGNAWSVMIGSQAATVFVDALAKNYGLSVRCVKNPVPVVAPNVSVGYVSNIMMDEFTFNATVSSSGGAPVSSRGIVWSTSPNPTIDNNEGMITQGSGLGAFVCVASGLTPNTTYYVRAFASNESQTGYSGEQSPTTDFANCGTVTDVDGNIYQTVSIGSQCWMRSNLKSTKYTDNTPIVEVTDDLSWSELITPGHCWYNNDGPANGIVYGALYNWYAIDFLKNGGRNLCPEGWHVPIAEDWTNLALSVGGESVAGAALKEAGTTHWLSPNLGATNSSGFTALPGGIRLSTGAFGNLGESGNFWTIYSADDQGIYFSLSNQTTELTNGMMPMSGGMSIRCIKNEDEALLPTVVTSLPGNITYNSADCGGEVTSEGSYQVSSYGVIWSLDEIPTLANAEGHTMDGNGAGTFTSYLTGLSELTTYYIRAYAVNPLGVAYGNIETFTTEEDFTIYDGDGNIYSAVTIGTQTWLTQNLFTTSFNDHTPIANLIDYLEWNNTLDPAFSWYDNDYSNYGLLYGALYNHASCNYIASKGRNICPEGYHVPITADWQELISFVGSDGYSGFEAHPLKSASGWMSGGDGIDVYGYTAMPGGMRFTDGSFAYVTETGYWWTQDEEPAESLANQYYMSFSSTGVISYASSISEGRSVRCIKNNDGAYVPVLTTTEPFDVTYHVGTSGGTISDEGGYPVTKKGLVWSTSENPTLDNASISFIVESGTGEFIGDISGLQGETTYYIRAFAINAVGVGYGNQLIFVTPEDTGIYDGDGNEYTPVTIGTQVWLKENLKTTTYNDGSPVLLQEDQMEWDGTVYPAYCWPYNDYDAYGNTYGALYKWYVNNFGMTQGKSVCPVGYHIPSGNEWTTLINIAGGTYSAAPVLRSVDYWMETFSTDDYGFTALPAGIRWTGSGFEGMEEQGSWWTSQPNNGGYTYAVNMSSFTDEVNLSESDPMLGFSVRCIQNPAGATAPTVTITDVTGITYESAVCTGVVTSNGGYAVISKGVVWSTDPNPTLSVNMGSYVLPSGIGSFTSPVDLLTENTTYYVRAFATNAIGVGYSDVQSFTTDEFLGIFDGDGNEYTSVTIGTQKWLTENLKTTSYTDASPIDNETDEGQWALPEASYCWYDNDQATYGNTYGALYNFFAQNPLANGGKTLCPDGWHVPADYEWMYLINYVGGETIAGTKLKASTNWQSGGEGTDDYGFTALPGGQRVSGDGFGEITTEAYFWTSTMGMNDVNTARNMSASDVFAEYSMQSAYNGLSIRCVQNPIMSSIPEIGIQEPVNVTPYSANFSASITSNGGFDLFNKGIIISTNPGVNLANAEQVFMKDNTSPDAFVVFVDELTDNTTYYIRAVTANAIGVAYSEEISFTTPADLGIVDGNGNVYSSVGIGSQEWLTTNLKANKYNDGTQMTRVDDEMQWMNLTDPAYCYYDNDSLTYLDQYGTLYNYYAVNLLETGGRNICPIGYHVPDYYEWEQLMNFVGGQTNAGGALKETGYAHWQAPNTGADDAYGFTALPGGVRESGIFNLVGFTGDWWLSTPYSDMSGWHMYLQSTTMEANYNGAASTNGLSVRCVRNQAGATVPAVNTLGSYDLLIASFTAEGNVADEGGTTVIDKGFIYGTNPNLTFNTASGSVSAGANGGWYDAPIEGLQPGVTYYFRAYAYNSQGMALGNIMSATTVMIPTPIDGDGNIYSYVIIGNQAWLAENLKATRFNDGSSIMEVTDNLQWQSIMAPAYSYYANNYLLFGEQYGVLYNGYVFDKDANGNRNACPVGWVVPDYSQWMTLLYYLGGPEVCGGMLKEAGSTHWTALNNSTNSTGFTALPGGRRQASGTFFDINTAGYWWSGFNNIPKPNGFGNAFNMTDDSDMVNESMADPNSGVSIRCVFMGEGAFGE
ncbi:MAG TPA: FISUMP domain-containing protein [Bacteroidales bacterium]|nr:FISUMP domain-containing protein [Bacteroidales bacterium]